MSAPTDTKAAAGPSVEARSAAGTATTGTATADRPGLAEEDRVLPEAVISADSHVTEPPDTYLDRIDPAFRDRAPHIERDERLGDIFVIPGMRVPVPMGLVAAAGKPAEALTTFGVRFEELHRGGWDPEARLADQDRDGVAGEVIYPTVGMALCNHHDLDYKHACMQAYNRWIAEFCAAHPDRLFGIGQTAMRSPEDGVADLRSIAALGLKGVMMPGMPGVEDYDSEVWEPVWEVAEELGLPLSFHVLTTRETSPVRGPRLNNFMTIIRANQDVIGTLVLSGVFERHPGLRVVCVEADAGWMPHFMYRMDHAFKRHRHWLPAGTLSRLPSEYLREHVYLTFQDDWVAFKVAPLLDVGRLMWANDFPHSDSTWPWSREILAEHTKDLSPKAVRRILHDNVAELYGLV
jgi:predicted TIM-barrel fold metal-dependent hydrolase